MLTRLIQRTENVSEQPIEYEYRDTEYEYEKKLEQKTLFEALDQPSGTYVEAPALSR